MCAVNGANDRTGRRGLPSAVALATEVARPNLPQ